MKKIIVALSSLLLVSFATPVTAATPEAIAIIDEQFSTAALGTNITEVCVSACNINLVPRKDQLADYNHGTQMAEIIRKNNPNAHLVLIRAGATNVSPVTSVGLRDALGWVFANYAKYNIKVISASVNAGNASTCSPTGGVSATEISSKIDSLKLAGIALIASAGNTSFGSNLNYPACIPNVIAVSAPNRQGLKSPYLDFVVRPNVPTNFISSVGIVAINNAVTTSATTALVAANWSTLSSNKVNSSLQIKLNVLQ